MKVITLEVFHNNFNPSREYSTQAWIILSFMFFSCFSTFVSERKGEQNKFMQMEAFHVNFLLCLVPDKATSNR